MTRLRIVGGRVLDPSRGEDRIADVVVEYGRIIGVARGTGSADGEQVVDARGLVVAPGFVDLHAHLREPGYEHRETIASGGAAALAGGFITVCAMPGTLPTVDTAADVVNVRELARRAGRVRVFPLGTMTKGQAGHELSEMADMAAAGAVAFSDDPRPVANSRLMRHALEYSRVVERPIVAFCEDRELAAGGLMHEGRTSARLGLPGIPPHAEEIALARDLSLVRLTGGRLHVAHVSTAAAVALLERAKQDGLPVTADVTPHHLLLTDDWLGGTSTLPPFDSRCRVSPPLRTLEDCAALQRGLASGVLDCVATDHAPLSRVERECELGFAEPGISGLETAFALLMQLVERGNVSLATLIQRLSSDAARVFDLQAGTLAPGAPADLVLLDPTAQWTVRAQELRSRGKNTPLDGTTLRGRVQAAFLDGTQVYSLETPVYA